VSSFVETKKNIPQGRPRPPEVFAPNDLQGQSPQFSAHVYCGQMAGWLKMPLGMEVGLGPGHNVPDEDPVRPKGAQPHNFRPISDMAKWLDGSRCHVVGR